MTEKAIPAVRTATTYWLLMSQALRIATEQMPTINWRAAYDGMAVSVKPKCQEEFHGLIECLAVASSSAQCHELYDSLVHCFIKQSQQRGPRERA